MQQNKHDHKFTNKLKVIIFAMFLLLPFLTMLPNAIYYAFNDNATNSHIESAAINYKYETNKVNSVEDLVKGNIYKFELDDYISEYSDYIHLNVLFSNCDFVYYEFDDLFYAYYDLYFNGYFDFYYDDGLTIDYGLIGTSLLDINLSGQIYGILLDDLGSLVSYDVDQFIFECPKEYIPIESVDTITQEMTITENLQYEFEKQWLNNPLFNWTQNNPIKQPINQFVAIFGIEQNTTLTNYLTYMISFIAIYIIFDIIIELFTFLTHILTSKNTN